MSTEAWVGAAFSILAGYTAWMTKMAIGLNDIRALIHRMDKVEQRVDTAHERLSDHDVALTRLAVTPRSGDAS